MVAFAPLSTDLYLPSLPALTQALEGTTAQGQLTLSVFLWGFALAIPVYGPLSDRYGRKPVLIGGTTLFVVASLLCALAWSIESLIVARLLQALGACAGPVVARAAVRDIYGAKRSVGVFSYIAAAMAVAPLIGPVIGGQLHALLGWQANFVLLAGVGLVGLVGCLGLLRESNARRNPRALSVKVMGANYRALLGHRLFVGYALSIAAVYSSIFCWISASSFVLIDLMGVKAAAFGLYFAVMVSGYILGALAGGRFGPRLGADRLILFGIAWSSLWGAVMAALAWWTEPSLLNLVGPMGLTTMGIGLALPNAQASALGPFPEKAGAASALSGFLQMTLAGVVGSVIGALTETSARPLATGVFLCMVVALVVFYGMVWRRRKQEAQAEAMTASELG